MIIELLKDEVLRNKAFKGVNKFIINCSPAFKDALDVSLRQLAAENYFINTMFGENGKEVDIKTFKFSSLVIPPDFTFYFEQTLETGYTITAKPKED